MNIPYDRRADVFADWLDAQVTGRSTPDAELQADAELADVCAAADQFHGLDAGLGQFATVVSPTPSRWEDIMVSHAIAPGATGQPVGRSNERSSLVPFERKAPAWDRVLSAVLAAAVVLALGAGALRVFDLGGFGGNKPPTEVAYGGLGSDGDDSGRLVPMATAEADQASSIPYPTADECTIEPLTRDEVVAHLTLANMATAEERPRYEQQLVPSEEDTAAIMQTFRMWQACNSSDQAWAYPMALETPWFSANMSPLFSKHDRPTTVARIEEFADIAIEAGGQEVLWPPMEASPSADAEPAYREDLVPILAGATPVTFDTSGTGSLATLFADEIVITGPDTASATVYFVNEETLEVSIHSPYIRYEFVKVDGQWLINEYYESKGGG